jgi:CYTH domain-containing protein
MAVERRFVLASSLARLLQREGGPAERVVEAYFPARSDRTQFVRVARNQAHLVLSSSGADGQASEEAVEVPHAHAEALVEVAAGTIAFDRTAVSLGRSVEGVLDRYILPQGLDLLTVAIPGDPRTFAPLLWLGPR